jgi:hypothetical protein
MLNDFYTTLINKNSVRTIPSENKYYIAMKCNYYIAMKCVYNRVEAERGIPKLKLFLLENLVNVQNKKVIFTLKRVKYKHLQEF